MNGKFSVHIHGWLLLLPAAVLLATFTHFPAVATLYHSFFSNPRKGREAVWVGLENYRVMADDPVFWQSLANNLWFALGTIPLSIALAILMAVWVNGRIPGKAFLRIAFFTPTVLPMIAVANIWLFFYTPQYGLLEQLTSLAGLPSHNWLGSRDTALACLVIVTIWKEAGFFMIFYLAALQSMPPNLAEAAAIEGAGRWYFFRRVTFPLLMPTTLFVLVNAVINSFRLVDHIVVMTRGGPDNVTSLLLLHLRRRLQVLGPRLCLGADHGAARHSGLARDRPVRVSGQAHALSMNVPYQHDGFTHALETLGAWVLALLWIAPLFYAFWTAFHPSEFSTHFTLSAPLTLQNFANAWNAAPFARYFVNTVALVTMVLIGQLVICTLAAYAFARFAFFGRELVFMLVLVQLMIMPDVMIVENYRTMNELGILDSIPAIGLPYMASAFGIFLLRQTFKTIPRELDEAARVEGASALQVLWKVYVPLARPTYLAYALVSVSYHWNNFLWPIIVTNSVNSRPLTVGLQVFSSTDQGIDWSIITAATLMTSAPLLLAFLLFQRQFVQSFMRAGIR
jgi:sn-glycerol 3-phosphate transport system permease protein